MKKTIWIIIMCMFFLLQGTWVNAENANVSSMITDTADGLKELSGSKKRHILSDKKVLQAGNSICDWIAITLAFSGEKEAYEDYLRSLEAYVTDSYKKNGSLSEVEATVYQKCVLTVLALGGNPQAFGKDASGADINILAEGTYDFKGNSLGEQGITGYIYALLALDTKKYPIPENGKYTKEEIVQKILEFQSQDGGFSLGGSGNDVDITAMTLQALAPYKEQSQVKSAIEQAINWLAEEMTPYGTFVSGTAESCESTAQVLLAMCALDILGDSRFQKEEMTPWKGLQQFRLEDGTYVHTLEERKGNLIATEQALLALEAVALREKDDRWIFDFREYELSEEQCVSRDLGMIMIAGIASILIILGVLGMEVKKRRESLCI